MSLLSQRDSLNCARETNLSSTGTGAFLLPTRLCDLGETTTQLVSQLRKKDIINADAMQTSQNVCEWLYQNIKYSIGATTLQTCASDVLNNRHGVCQDFAHAMIALCRACRIPARYVSGFNVGEGQMHAWVETLCGKEWKAFDPTHGRQTLNDCVFVACGRDFRDVSPLRGRFQGDANVDVKTWCETRVVS
jgi:transglutaminase-like putative cysteine protease